MNCEGAAVTPVGIPVTVTLTAELNPFKAVTLTVTELEEPVATVTLVGCTVSVKSGGGGGGDEVPPPEPPQLASTSAASSVAMVERECGNPG